MESRQEDKRDKLGMIIAQWLKKQLDRWGDEGILNQNQKDAIKNLYVWPELEAARTTEEKPAIKLVVILQAPIDSREKDTEARGRNWHSVTHGY